ncbi:unnamed protein product [Medioppia subpectinata]|uniref:EGF-like domain-containing protein n=1 Tax=Medioppia subpectinata TaxID=1979941 RepID=A0A7R9PU70_9ACAR|nr:unnamed protein product [Medioppia subpectinata]CAG2100466.1 unnamed protein product [Medioppia subpectinata]
MKYFVLLYCLALILPQSLVGVQQVVQSSASDVVTVFRNSNCRYRTYGNCRLRSVPCPSSAQCYPPPVVQQHVDVVQQHVDLPVVQQHVVQQQHVDVVQQHVDVIPTTQRHVDVIHVPRQTKRITACPQGHYLSADGTHCKHIDCDVGFTFSDEYLKCVDINECERHVCLHDESCINTHGSYICRKICTQSGYRLDVRTNTCEDINECVEGTHLCGPQQTCINRPGGHECQCPPGFRLNGPLCEDINECLHSHVCPAETSHCHNIPGSYRCVCKSGFKDDGSGKNCLDVNECLIGNGGCSHVCINKFGSYECSCPKGYELSPDGRTCLDINECAKYGSSHLCTPETSTCVNTPGSYHCDCKLGFRDDGSRKNCLDVDECSEHTHLCQQKCVNTFGSYKCLCNRGYRLVDTHRCEDIDECHEGDFINTVAYSRFKSDTGRPQLCQGHCENTLGSYHCTCPHGYKLQYDHHCVDVNECQEHGYCRGHNQTCVNLGGSFRCIQTECPHGYHRDGAQRLVYAEICDDPHIKCDINQIICYSYAYIPFRSNFLLKSESGSHEFFTFIVPIEPPIIAEFGLRMISVKSPNLHVRSATREDFYLKRSKDNEVKIALLNPLEGPQDIELEIEAKMYKNGIQIGRNIATVMLFISEFEY